MPKALESECDRADVGEPEGMALGSGDEVFSAGAPLSWGVEVEAEGRESGGRVVSDMRYWKPWQPPLSTEMRRARFGFSSLAMISRRRWLGLLAFGATAIW